MAVGSNFIPESYKNQYLFHNPVLKTIEVLPTNTITYHSPVSRNAQNHSQTKERSSDEKTFGIVSNNHVSRSKKRNFLHNEFMGGIYSDMSKSLERDLREN